MAGPVAFLAAEVFGAATSPLTGPISRTASYTANILAPNQMPSVPELLWANRTGWITDSVTENILNHWGVTIDPTKWQGQGIAHKAFNVASQVWQRVWNSQRPQPALMELLTLRNRDDISDKDVDLSLKHQGFDDGTVRKRLASLRFEIPGPSDLVRFAVRHVFEPDIIQQLGYNDEFRPVFADWLGKQGLNYALPPLKDAAGNNFDWTWAQAYWWSHWILPSNEAGFEMLRRLRPTGGANGGPRDESGEVFDKKTLELLLRANDVPPFWRKKLTAISYRPIGLRQLQQIADAGLVPREEIKEKWMDLGYSPNAAETLTQLTESRTRQKRWKEATAGAKQIVRDAYQTGILDRTTAFISLYSISLDDPKAISEYLAKPDNEKLDIAEADLSVSYEVHEIDAKGQTERAKKAIDATKQMYLGGRISKDQAFNRLTQIGIVGVRQADIVQEWDQEFGLKTKELSTQQLLKAFTDGIITESALVQQLQYLGWSDPYITVMVADAVQQKLAKIPPADKILAKLRSDLRSHSSPAMMKKWLGEGTIDPLIVVERLKFLQWPDDDIQRFLDDACKIKGSSGCGTAAGT